MRADLHSIAKCILHGDWLDAWVDIARPQAIAVRDEAYADLWLFSTRGAWWEGAHYVTEADLAASAPTGDAKTGVKATEPDPDVVAVGIIASITEYHRRHGQ